VDVAFGSGFAHQHLELIAVNPPFKFSFPLAAPGDFTQSAITGQWTYWKAATRCDHEKLGRRQFCLE
jgi:hypothetical protein